MGEKIFEVEKDDISISNLSAFDIHNILIRTRGKDSPESLWFRVMPDSNILYIQQKDWSYNDPEFAITCYRDIEYLRGIKKYSGRGFRWSISAKYSTVRKDYSTIRNDLSLSYVHRVGALLLINKMQCVKLSINERDNNLSEFSNYYLGVKENLKNTQTWISGKLEMRADCSCGHSGIVKNTVLSALFSRGLSIEDIKSRLKCDDCGSKEHLEIMSLYNENTPSEFRHEIYWPNDKRPRSGSILESSKIFSHRNPELEGMYKNLGGDGEGPVYLGDGAYLSSSGEVFDD
ncbi:hypothetical protein [Microvirga tunisiensis]|uniref:Uncharacterized protein n=1 Tax=Microvirga tunisiensis TaxID=2108360 RepID=A0A5N7MEG0_9HYPH|nr:hypothetical protein [Microvirga tunisiensis]MPR06176.1 hypothetical protein [Microvirga tunisiensis]MPR25255.1 hypothetical protein [Microvirga tunisiensis]